MTTINIISHNKCVLNLDASGIFEVNLQGPTGYWVPKLLTDDDWIEYQVGTSKMRIAFKELGEVIVTNDLPQVATQTEHNVLVEETTQTQDSTKTEETLQTNEEEEYEEEEEINVVTRELSDVEENGENPEQNTKQDQATQTPTDPIGKIEYYTKVKLGDEVLEGNQFDVDDLGFYKFPKPITDCSNRVKHLLGIINLPATKSQVPPSVIGPRFVLIKCNQINTPMRFANQLIKVDDEQQKKKRNYPSVQNIGSINFNSNGLNQLVVLNGASFTAPANEICDLEFRIVDIYGDDIQLDSDFLWTFQLNKISDEHIKQDFNPNENNAGQPIEEQEPNQNSEQQVVG